MITMAEKVRGRPLPHLREWRIRRALSQAELADAAGVVRGTVARAERGGAVSFPNIRQLAAALHLTVEQLDEGPK